MASCRFAQNGWHSLSRNDPVNPPPGSFNYTFRLSNVEEQQSDGTSTETTELSRCAHVQAQ